MTLSSKNFFRSTFTVSIFTAIFAAALSVTAQSARAPQAKPTPEFANRSVKELYAEVGGYLRAKAAEYDAKKIAFSDALLERTRLEQRQLAAKYAAAAGQLDDLSGEDIYYRGMLHWIAQNYDGALSDLDRIISSTTTEIDKVQSARAVVTVILAKKDRLDDAERSLADYKKEKNVQRISELQRMETEIAKAYAEDKDFESMAPHAAEAFSLAKATLSEPGSRVRSLDDAIDTAMLVFEAYRERGDTALADTAMDDLRRIGIVMRSPTVYYYAVDRKITFMIATGRKPQALSYFGVEMKSVSANFPDAALTKDVQARFKKREAHYQLLNEPVKELPTDAVWPVGDATTLASLKGKVVLLDFWATWCTPCLEAFPHINEWRKEFGSKGFEVVGVTRYYGRAGVEEATPPVELEFLKGFIAKHGIDYSNAIYVGQAAQMQFGATTLPTAVLIDRKGIIRYIEPGTSSSRIAEMGEMIKKLVDEK